MSLEPEVPKRGLTKFLCQELLYDYVGGHLDARREEEVAKFLKTDKDAQRELEKIKRGLAYAGTASALKVRSGLHTALVRFEPPWQKRIRETTTRFASKGWQYMPHIAISLTLILGVIALKPWQITEQQDAILAEQLKQEPDMLPPQPEVPVAPSTPVFPNVIPPLALQPLVLANPQNLVAAVPVPRAVEMPIPTQVAATPAPVTVAANIKSEISDAAADAAASSEAASNDVVAEQQAPKSEKPTTTGSRGFLMRGEMDVSDFHNTWPAIRDKIQALGGKTAGSVELGWLRTPSQSYFHFALPESNYSELELFLGTFGPVRFSNERHPRVMPQGQIRIILTVKEGAGNEGSTETP